jgi:hypothetical protein
VTAPGPLDYAEGWQLAAELAEQVRARKAAADRASAAASAAIDASRAASGDLSEVLGPWRQLLIALADGAGHDGKHPLAPAIERAREVLGLAVTPPE